MTAVQALLHQRCPRCREGPIFLTPLHLFHGWLAMYERCPVCQLKYEREQGYFIGAMYVSYGLAVPPYLAIVAALWLGAGWRYDLALAAAVIAYLPFVPLMMRFSRVVWMHLDQTFDPQQGV